MFLDPTGLYKLTGYRQKRRQIAVLREQGVPFYVNGLGEPVVACSALEGQRQAAPKPVETWTPAVLRRA